MHEPYVGMKIDLENISRLREVSGSARESASERSCNLCDLPIAMAYVPMQQWKTTYSPSEALCTGTVFPELNLPFKGGRRR